MVIQFYRYILVLKVIQSDLDCDAAISSASIDLPKQTKNLGITDTSSAQDDPLLLKKRKIYAFCTAWKSGRPWLESDNAMFCNSLQSRPSQMHFV